MFTANELGLGTLLVHVRGCDPSNEFDVELVLVLALGIAGPKKSVAELINLLIGALTDQALSP